MCGPQSYIVLWINKEKERDEMYKRKEKLREFKEVFALAASVSKARAAVCRGQLGFLS